MEIEELLQETRKKSVEKTPSPYFSALTSPSLIKQSPEKPVVLDAKSSAKARGRRLRTARMMTGLTRKALEEKYNISASTIQAWEAAKAGGLTERGVARILAVLQQEGISCTAEWLLYDIGAGPQHMGGGGSLQTNKLSSSEAGTNSPESRLITQELLVFRSLHLGTADLVVLDDGMEPKFRRGDYVAGVSRTGEAIEDAIGLDCIVQTSDGNALFRRVKKSARSGLYNLMCVNPNTEVTETTVYDQALVSAAPVIWHRRSDMQ